MAFVREGNTSATEPTLDADAENGSEVELSFGETLVETEDDDASEVRVTEDASATELLVNVPLLDRALSKADEGEASTTELVLAVGEDGAFTAVLLLSTALLAEDADSWFKDDVGDDELSEIELLLEGVLLSEDTSEVELLLVVRIDTAFTAPL